MNEQPRCSVLVVDDSESNIDLMVGTIGNEYEVSVALDGETALELASTLRPDLILLDIMMPDMDGYDVCRILKEKELTRNIPVVFVTALVDEGDESKGLELGALDYITKPFKPAIVRNRVRNHIALKRHRDNLEDLVNERTRELTLTQEVAIESLATLAEYRDPETGGHIRRTQKYVKILAESLQHHPACKRFLNDGMIDLLYKSAPLHDIGKVAVPDNILLKPGQLSTEEFEEMKKHTCHGRNAIMAAEKKLGSNSFLHVAKEVAYTHQEKWDGSGYPQGLKGEEIPISGRLMALADVYDALISRRVYKAPIPHKEAIAIIAEGTETHFDPNIVNAFLDLEEEFRQIAFEYADYDEERRALVAN